MKAADAPLTSAAAQDALRRYFESRRARIPEVLAEHLNLKSCAKIQTRHFLGDLARNPANTLWAIPYVTIHKFLEIGEKLGIELARSVSPHLPRAFKTDFQREVERLLEVDLFGFPTDVVGRSALARELDADSHVHSFLNTEPGRVALLEAERDLRDEIAKYCEKQHSVTDLAASGATLVFAQLFFGDRSLDVFAMGRRWSALWARQKAETHFFLGRKFGHEFYKLVPPPSPTTAQVYLATAAFLALLALFTTSVNVFSYPARALAGLERKQLESLLQSSEDRLLLLFTKALNAIRSG